MTWLRTTFCTICAPEKRKQVPSNILDAVPHSHNEFGGVVVRITHMPQRFGGIGSIGVRDPQYLRHYVETFGNDNPWSDWLTRQEAL